MKASLANEWAELSREREHGDAVKIARTKWLRNNRAEASFPCGVVEVDGTAIPALVAVVPDGLAFLAETPHGAAVYDVLEVGRIARSEVAEVDVVDAQRDHVPEPLRESFEDDVDVWLILRWRRDGEEHEDRFHFRSPWMAWRAARRLLEARGA